MRANKAVCQIKPILSSSQAQFTMKRTLTPILLLLLVFVQSMAQQVEHHKVYYEPGKFGGWPANWGIWSWGDEILVGFAQGYHLDLGEERHNIDREKTELHLLARSKDGGKTWEMEDPGKKEALVVPNNGSYHGQQRTDVAHQEIRVLEKPIDFTHPDFVMTVRSDNMHAGKSRLWYSYDRGQTWQGPHAIPSFDAPGTGGRTDYMVNGPNDAFIFITAAKSDGKEGRPMCIRTRNGGMSWDFESWIGPEPEGFGIMPASVRIGSEELYVVVRRREADRRYLGAYRSLDNGKTWSAEADPVENTGEGNPPALIKLKDGRLCLVYGYRAAPFSIRARLSEDGGRTWSKDYILREDGAGRDIGYPRVVQRNDGKIVAVYYFTDEATGKERYISATIWQPGEEIVSR